MATLYFTTNASSGDGSLASLYASASDGDIIAPDPSVFPLGSTIEIALTSALNSACDITIDGAGRRIRFNGVNAPRCIVGGAYSHTFNDCDFVGFTGKAQTIVAVGSGELHFNRCLIAGCDTTGTGIIYGSGTSVITLDDSAVYGVSAGSGAVYVAGTSTLTITRSTVIGNVARDIYAGGSCVTSAVNSIYQTALNMKSAIGCTVGAPSTIGFVAPPPDAVTYDASAWESWNLHLIIESTSSGEVDTDATGYDLEGIPRALSSIVGAYGTVDCDYYGNANGWSEERFGTYSDEVKPTSHSICFLDASATYDFGGGALNLGCITRGNIVFTLTHGGIYHLEQGLNASATVGDDALLQIAAEKIDTVTLSAGSSLLVDGVYTAEIFTVPADVEIHFLDAVDVDLLTVNGMLAIEDVLTAADLTVSDGATVYLGAMARLSVTTEATLGACTVTAYQRGYFATPAETDLTDAEIAENVATLTFGAGCSNFNATYKDKTTVKFAWNQSDDTVNPLLERAGDDGWETLSASASTDFEYVGNGGTFRLYDGEGFLTDTLAPINEVAFWQVKAWADASISGGTEGDTESFSVSVWAVSPNLE